VSWFLDLGLAGLVFLGLCVWLIRRVAQAAGTERDLEGERLKGALAEELAAAKARVAGGRSENEKEHQQEHDHEHEHQRAHDDLNANANLNDPLSGADVVTPDPAHLPLIAALVAEREQSARAQHTGPTDVPRRIEVLWVRSNPTHAVWCERRHAATVAARAMTKDVICVALINRGRITERWFFG
jgi:ABC-type Zn2+ transport system substrate-binding protein/surface adhesin